MNNLLKNKPLLIVAGVILIVVVFGGLLFFKNASNSGQQVNNNILPTEIPVPTISPDELGLTIEVGEPGKTVILTVKNTEGISAIEYELSYMSKGDLPRGAVGSLDLKKKPATKEVKLGSCSDVCHYDEDVSNIKVVLKITREDGSIYSYTASLDSSE